MELQQFCTMCSNTSTVLCKTCKCSGYCSTACFQADMPIHQILCGELQNFLTPPNASARRGIFFPVDQQTPQFVWATTRADKLGYEDLLNFKPYIGNNAWLKIRITGNYIRSRPRQDQIVVLMSEASRIDGSEVNSSVAALAEGNALDSWRGGILAMKLETLETDLPGRYIHMDMVDFRDLVDLFRSHKSKTVKNMSDERYNQHHKGPASPLDSELKAEFQQADMSKSKKTASESTASPSSFHETVCDTKLYNLKVKEKNKNHETKNNENPPPVQELSGVRINCGGDRKSGRAQFEPIKVATSSSVWSASIPTISELVGLLIRVQQIPPPEDVVAPPAKTKRGKKKRQQPRMGGTLTFDKANEAAKFLHVNANPNSKDWGLACPLEWPLPTGSVTVVHAERKAILPQHVEALCHFCQYVMQPFFEDSMGTGVDPANPIQKSDVLRRLSPREFALFYSGFTKWKRDNNPTYESVDLPS